MTLETNIPIPHTPGGNRKYPWSEMGIGESFFIGAIEVERISSLATRAARRLGRKFTCRTITVNGSRGVRVWRIA